MSIQVYLQPLNGIARNKHKSPIEMKIFHLALRSAAALCLAVFLSSASCDLFGDADDITFNATLEHTFQVNETADSQSPVPYASKPQDEVLDAAKINSEFDKYKEQIESISIKKITYTLSDYESKYPAIAFSGGSLTFSHPTVPTTETTVVGNVQDMNLQASASAGTPFTLNVDQVATDKIAKLLKDDQQVRIHAVGTLSKTPLKLKVKVTVECSVTASALK